MENISIEIMKSWADRKGSVTSNEEILQWIRNRSASLKVNVEQIDFSYSGFWFYDEETGYIRNQSSSFFQLAGYQEIEDDLIVAEQPVIIQDEIGYLGIICKMMNGTLHFLMQAKIEPGNVNVIQISPTLQATKSNFYRKHGGKAPDHRGPGPVGAVLPVLQEAEPEHHHPGGRGRAGAGQPQMDDPGADQGAHADR